MMNGISWGVRPVVFAAAAKKGAAKAQQPATHPMEARMAALNLTPPYGFDPQIHFVGDKYQPRLDLAEIARRIRGDIQDAINTGALPPRMRTSVTIERGGKGCINVSVKSLPNWTVVSAESIKKPVPVRLTTVSHWGNSSQNNPGVTKETLAMLETLEKIVKAYNYDAGDSQYDYASTHFYAHVGLDHDYLNRELAKVKN